MRTKRAFVAMSIVLAFVLTGGGAAEAQIMPQPDPANPDILVLEANCNTQHDKTVYSFTARVEIAVKVNGGGNVKSLTWAYFGEDPVDPSNVPNPAYNNVHIELRQWDSGSLVKDKDSPDDENYVTRDPGAVYGDDPGWAVAPLTPYFVRFTPAFDKRTVSDQHCDADTSVFVAASAKP